MSKLTLMVLILAVGLGLFVWFNPPARERAEAAWDDARTYAVQFYARISPSFEGLFSTSDEPSGGETASAESSSGSGAGGESGDGLGFALSLDSVVQSMRDVWLSFTARLGLELS